MAGKNQKGRYELKFRLKNGTTTQKFYQLRSDRDREADRLRRERGNELVWLKVKDR